MRHLPLVWGLTRTSAGDQPVVPQFPQQPIQGARPEQRPARHGAVHGLQNLDSCAWALGEGCQHGTGGWPQWQMPVNRCVATIRSVLHYLQ